MNNPKEEEAASIPPRYRLSCTECFDALWFCYSPVHQMQQYYRHGVLDSCSEKWSALFDCFNLKTKRSSEVQLKGCVRSTAVVSKLNVSAGPLVIISEVAGHKELRMPFVFNFVEILEARERSKTHIWSYRSVDEASSNWKKLFGHINDEE